jgi:hypothetical protein
MKSFLKNVLTLLLVPLLCISTAFITMVYSARFGNPVAGLVSNENLKPEIAGNYFIPPKADLKLKIGGKLYHLSNFPYLLKGVNVVNLFAHAREIGTCQEAMAYNRLDLQDSENTIISLFLFDALCARKNTTDLYQLNYQARLAEEEAAKNFSTLY